MALQSLKELFIDFMEGNESKNFRNLLMKLTPEHLQKLTNIYQQGVLSQQRQPFTLELSKGDEPPTKSLLITLNNCEQFQIYNYTLILKNNSQEEVPYKILNLQKGNLAVRFIPWNGTISGGEVILIYHCYFYIYLTFF